MLYVPKEDQTISVLAVEIDGKIQLNFSSDCGKFGTDEELCSLEYTPRRLLEILHKDYEDSEIEE